MLVYALKGGQGGRSLRTGIGLQIIIPIYDLIITEPFLLYNYCSDSYHLVSTH